MVSISIIVRYQNEKTSLMLSALALSLGMALTPVSAFAAETSSSVSSTNSQQLPSLAPMLEKVMPSVVSISVEGSTTVKTPRMPQQFQQFLAIIRLSARTVRHSWAHRFARAVTVAVPLPRQIRSSKNLERWALVSSLTLKKAMWSPITMW